MFIKSQMDTIVPGYYDWKQTQDRIDRTAAIAKQAEQDALRYDARQRMETLLRLDRHRDLIRQSRQEQDARAETDKRVNHLKQLLKEEHNRRLAYVNRLMAETAKDRPMENMQEYLNAKYGPPRYQRAICLD